jgi:hypothetical protein
LKRFFNLGKLMIALDNLTVSTQAAAGTTVGTLTLLNESLTAIAANFQLTKNSAGFFATSGNQIVTLSSALPAGNYAVVVRAVGTNTWWSEEGSYVITVTA